MVAVGLGSPVLDGEESGQPLGYATTCVPPGVTKLALVVCGSTGLSSGGDVVSLISPELDGARMRPTIDGVGVIGGGFDALAVRFEFGVTGNGGTLKAIFESAVFFALLGMLSGMPFSVGALLALLSCSGTDGLLVLLAREAVCRAERRTAIFNAR